MFLLLACVLLKFSFGRLGVKSNRGVIVAFVPQDADELRRKCFIQHIYDLSTIGLVALRYGAVFHMRPGALADSSNICGERAHVISCWGPRRKRLKQDFVADRHECGKFHPECRAWVRDTACTRAHCSPRLLHERRWGLRSRRLRKRPVL